MHNADTYTHKHPHTHTNQYAYAPADIYPHTHTDDADRNDSHAHWHRTDEPHTHLGDALGLPEYWRRRIRWWWYSLVGRRFGGWRRRARDGRGHNRSGQADQVGCRTCRSMGMMGMAMMFGIPMPCPACAARRNE